MILGKSFIEMKFLQIIMDYHAAHLKEKMNGLMGII